MSMVFFIFLYYPFCAGLFVYILSMSSQIEHYHAAHFSPLSQRDWLGSQA